MHACINVSFNYFFEVLKFGNSPKSLDTTFILNMATQGWRVFVNNELYHFWSNLCCDVLPVTCYKHGPGCSCDPPPPPPPPPPIHPYRTDMYFLLLTSYIILNWLTTDRKWLHLNSKKHNRYFYAFSDFGLKKCIFFKSLHFQIPILLKYINDWGQKKN